MWCLLNNNNFQIASKQQAQKVNQVVFHTSSFKLNIGNTNRTKWKLTKIADKTKKHTITNPKLYIKINFQQRGK